MKILKTILLLFIGFQVQHAQAKIYKPTDFPTPRFTGTNMFFNPDNRISDENMEGLEDLREIYFFDRYIELICISVNSINQSGDKFIDELVKKWDLKNRINNRYVIQLRVNNSFYFQAGPQLESLLDDAFFTNTINQYQSNFKYDKKGNYDYIIAQKIGAKIYDNIPFDYQIDYKLSDKHASYPAFISFSDGFKTATTSEIFGGVSNQTPHSKPETQNQTQSSNQTQDQSNLSNSLNTSESESVDNEISHAQIDYANIKMANAGDILSTSDVPNQRGINDIWVSDPHHILSSSEVPID